MSPTSIASCCVYLASAAGDSQLILHRSWADTCGIANRTSATPKGAAQIACSFTVCLPVCGRASNRARLLLEPVFGFILCLGKARVQVELAVLPHDTSDTLVFAGATGPPNCAFVANVNS